ncbi:hypothetical protein DL93DRAFT_2222741 [Clavulina sp. PMI_390]|nr:hypothetical protein DL93DRAFT_2222741 [Clavulina sp. PMI_390]
MGKALVDVHDADAENLPNATPTTDDHQDYAPPSPSISLLFSFCSRRDIWLGLVPAIIVSLAAGGLAPFMTFVVGQAFDAFANFTNPSDPGASALMLHRISIVSLELIGLAIGQLVFSSLTSTIWLWLGEQVVLRVRQRMFHAITVREIEWFDLLGENNNSDDQNAEAIGAGGLMAKFTRDTDDVRHAVSLNMGMLIEHTTTFITALILAFVGNARLAGIVFISVPALILTQAISQMLSGPRLDAERRFTASAGTHIERAVASIATVKAFNAINVEVAAAGSFIDRSVQAYRRCIAVWAGASGITQFVVYAMFVQGFWYGAHLVHSGQATAGTVMSVFWACLIASSNLQLMLTPLTNLVKGKNAMVSIYMMIDPPPSPPKPFLLEEGKRSQDSILPTYYESVSAAPTPAFGRPTTSKSSYPLPRRPNRCLGTFDIPRGLTFHYASRPNAPPALRISKKTPIHVAGADLTFFVGGSGSGKSTLAQLFMQMYQPDLPTHGAILMDEIPLEDLDKAWVRENVALVSQECILFDMSVHDNVAIGKLSLESMANHTVSREEVEIACRVAMVHDFVKDLPDGYDTQLGTGGASLSGGQRQRVALARAILRNPSVLILDEATSALDASSRVLVFEAIKHYRRRKTTIVITHDLSQITDEDYVYVMKAGRLVEEGFRSDLAAVKVSPFDEPSGPIGRAVSTALEIEEIELEQERQERLEHEQGRGEFKRMLDKQMQAGGFPVRNDLPDVYEETRAEAFDVVERVLSPEPSSLMAGPSTSKLHHRHASASASGLLAAPSEISRPGTALSMRGTPGASGSGAGSSSRGPHPPTASAGQNARAGKKRKRMSVPWQVDAMRDIFGSSSSSGNGAAGPTALRDLTQSRVPPRIHTRYTSHRGKSSHVDDIEAEDGLVHNTFDEEDFEDDDTIHDFSDEEDAEDVTAAHDSATYPNGDVIPMRKRLHKRNASTSSLPSPTPRQTEFNRHSMQMALHSVTPKRQSMNFEPWVYPLTPRRSQGFQISAPMQREGALSAMSNPEIYVEEEDEIVDDESFDDDKSVMRAVGARVQQRRRDREAITIVAHDSSATLAAKDGEEQQQEKVPSLFAIIRAFYSTVPHKPWVAFGLLCAAISGALTPVFSWALAHLMADLGVNAGSYSTTLKYGLMVLFISIADGIFFGLKFYLLEDGAMNWVASLRKASFERVMKQDKSWFDDSQHSPERMVQILIKDGDDARTIIATILPQILVVFAMIGLGIGWAFANGWQLSLVALGVAVVFAIVTVVQTSLSGKYELRNKRAREDVARRYYEVVANIRAIRSMALESVFQRDYDVALEKARKTGTHGAFIAGISTGLSQALIYLTEALLFWVGAHFIANGTYTYLKLITTLDLLIFSVSIAGQMLTFVPQISASKQAAADFGKLLKLGTYTSESRGLMRYPVHGDIVIDDVFFNYPNRPDVSVLRGVNTAIRQGECVAIVGPSGSGKSTIGSLLQRLYEPASGRISVGGYNLADMDVAWLRNHVAVVSQHPVLFDVSIADNITYGTEPGSVSREDVEYAARAANLHDFVETLPNGYDTTIGEKAALLSGGQAQRLQIARALVNGRANIMVFDECTSALDPTNQAAVMDTIKSVKHGRTTLLITHKLPVMQMCDRILVVDGGRIVEDGTFDDLMRMRGTFHKLASAGEWANVD